MPKFTIPARLGYMPVVVTIAKGEGLREAVLKAVAERAYLQGAYLQGADLQGADLRDADLQDADLQGAYLQGAYLQDADLRGAYLQGADLRGAYLQDAALRGAYLRGAYLRGAKPAEGEPARPVDQIQGLRGRAYRSDGYEFQIFRMEDAGLIIRACCRTFTPDEFEAHIAREYDGSPKADETRRIIAFLIAQANAEAWT